MRILIAALAVAFLTIGTSSAIADTQTLTQRHDLNIPAGDLATALKLLAEQSGTDLVYRPEQIQGLTTEGVKGDITAQDAIKRLLQGTSLQVSTDATGAMLIAAPLTSGKQVSSSMATDPTAIRLAQNTDSTESQTSKTSSTAESSSEDSASKGIQEIVVTAQKREERLQDVPISISVLSGADLDKSTAVSVTEVLSRVPGVTTIVAAQNGGTQLSIRGVTAAGPNYYGASPVSYYLDSVPFALVRSAIVPDANPYDLDRIEVLRGPQGTLYGASAQNGVVRVLTQDPRFDKLELKSRASLSSTEEGGGNQRIDAAVNLPLIDDKLAVRAVVGYQDLSGWIDHPDGKNANDTEVLTGRVKLRAEPTEDLAIGLSAWFSRTDIGAPSYSADELTSPFVNEPLSIDYDIFALTIDYDFVPFRLTSSSSYIDFKAHGLTDFNFLAPIFGVPSLELETIDTAEIVTEELILNSNSTGPWRWTLGAMYRNGDAPEYQDFGPLTPVVPLNFLYESKSWAIFGELTRKLLDGKLELTAGLRYFEDEVEQREILNFDGSGPLERKTSQFDQLSPRLVLTWHVADTLTAYASYAEGFRSGADQGLLVRLTRPDFSPVKEDTVANYELGFKGSTWNGRLSFDTALYFIDWQDMQLALAVPYRGTSITAQANSESASGLGFEFATTAQLLSGLSVTASFNWNDLTNDEDVFTFPLVNGVPQPVLLFPKGSRVNNSGQYTAGLAADYVFPLGGSGYTSRLSASANYASKLESRDVTGNSATERVGDSLLFSRASWGIESGDRWTASLFIENIGNYQDVYQSNVDPRRNIRPRPRTYGVQLEYRL